MLTKLIGQQIGRQSPQRPDRPDAQLLTLAAGDAADAPQPSHRQWVQKLLDAIRIDNDQSIRLFEVAGDLGQKLVGGDTDRRNQPNRLSNLLLDRCGNLDRGAKQSLAAGDVRPKNASSSDSGSTSGV